MQRLLWAPFPSGNGSAKTANKNTRTCGKPEENKNQASVGRKQLARFYLSCGALKANLGRPIGHVRTYLHSPHKNSQRGKNKRKVVLERAKRLFSRKKPAQKQE